MKHYDITYKFSKLRWKKFKRKYVRFAIFTWKKDSENWDELFIDYDKYQILPLKIEDLVEAEREIDGYLDFITNELVNNFEELYLLERDIDSFYINLRQGKESFEYPPYPHGDYVLFDFSDGNYIFGERMKEIFTEISRGRFLEKQ
ncbi:hypothetical protein [Staphylococcus americanisciuri]|uniref:DUF2262 domain-containing protein n=1 Tax=Staphylococcus americanisciuri TaxID=2973940 RepID=A0ABT2F1A9_9STAP|nr:hypothetical protein [Staphylococcus americanisciuri]MCS4485938.1 hypothetical protein [Staphylococcus americanisciuri]